jgi:uncharacterized membrane protein YgcG
MSDVGLMSLSNETLLKIFQYLTYASDILLLGATCKRLAAIAKDESIWQRLVKEDFPEVVKHVVGSSDEDGKRDGGTLCSKKASRTSSSKGSAQGGSNSKGTGGGGPSAGSPSSGSPIAGAPGSGEPRIGEDEDADLFATWRSAYR